MFYYFGSNEFKKAQPSGLNWLLAHSPIPIIGEWASWREASSVIEKDREAVLRNGEEYTSFRSAVTRMGEMAVDRLFGYLIIPVIYPQTFDLAGNFARKVIDHIQ